MTDQSTADPTHAAWSDSRTRRQWESYRTGTGFLLLATVALSAVAALYFSTIYGHDDRLLRKGSHAIGTVVGGGVGGRHSQDYVEVEFTTARGQFVRGALHGPSTDELPTGLQIDVVYDPQSPHRFRTVDYANHSNLVDNLLILSATIPAILLICVLVAGRRMRRWKRVLQAGPWQTWTVCQFAYRSRSRSVLLARKPDAEGGDEVALGFASTLQGALGSLSLSEGDPVLVRFADRRHGILSTPGARRPFEVLLPRSDRQQRRWHKLIDKYVYSGYR